MSTATAPPPPQPAGRRALPGTLGDTVFRLLCTGAAWLVVVLFIALIVVLVVESWQAISTIGLSFFTSSTWDPEPSHRKFGALAFIYGTVVTAALAMLMAVPLGVGTAVFLAEIAPRRLRTVGTFFVEMLAAVPSVIYGFWGLFVLAPFLQSVVTSLGGPNQGGLGILPASVVLAIMVVPYIASVSFDVLRAVPRAQREGALALGASRWQTIWGVVLPYARPGIIGASFLALGRALGETMAVTMLIGNRADIKFSVFAMGNTIPSAIANEFTEATYDLYLSALVELGLVLLLVNVAVNALARVLIWRMGGTGIGPSLFGRLMLRVRGETPTTVVGSTPEVPAEHLPAVNVRWTMFVNRLMTVVLGLCTAVSVGFLFLILGYVVYRGVGGINAAFFLNMPAPVGQKGGGMVNAIFGSAVLVGLAALFAVPVGLLAAIYLAEFRGRRLAPAVRFVGELLGGVPSIVIGIFAYTLVVRPMGDFSAWAGSFALGVMMLPIVMRASEEALKLVPETLRHASYALGAKRWQTIVYVSIPAALPAIITAVFLGIARIAGETAPLLLTASSNQFWPLSPSDWTPSLPVYIFTYAVSPYEDWHRQAWAASLFLLAVVMVLNFGVRLLAGKRLVQAGEAA